MKGGFCHSNITVWFKGTKTWKILTNSTINHRELKVSNWSQLIWPRCHSPKINKLTRCLKFLKCYLLMKITMEINPFAIKTSCWLHPNNWKGKDIWFRSTREQKKKSKVIFTLKRRVKDNHKTLKRLSIALCNTRV